VRSRGKVIVDADCTEIVGGDDIGFSCRRRARSRPSGSPAQLHHASALRPCFSTRDTSLSVVAGVERILLPIPGALTHSKALDVTDEFPFLVTKLSPHYDW
jgi:hypothetical protein